VSFTQYQGVSRFQNAPKVNFFLQSHFVTLPKLECPSHIESRPLLRLWNMLFMGFMISSAFGLYAHASLNELPTNAIPDVNVTSLPSYENVLLSEPKDKSRPLKPLTDTVQQLAVIEPYPSAADLRKPIDASAEPSPLSPVSITGGKQLAFIENSLPDSIDDANFEGLIDESGLQPKSGGRPSVKPQARHATNGKKTVKTTTPVAQQPPADRSFDSVSADAVDEDQLLLDKILAKPRVALATPRLPLKPGAGPHLNDIEVDIPESRFGPKTTLGSSARFMSPLRRLNVSSRFGWRYGRMHAGIDLAAPTGTDILAANNGVVVFSGWQGGYGRTVIIDHGNGKQTRYAHCQRLMVSQGQRVRQGERIGLVGNTGHSTGSHLHFEVLVHGVARNPEQYLFR
jgi:murein DD-endopeptidase MepM/ murein hydrolase activator NlpD